MTKVEWMEKNGFSPEGLTYIVYGDNTYSIKNHLKELGYKFNSLLKWHAPEPIALNLEDFGTICVSFDEVAEWYEEEGCAYYKDGAKDLIDKKIALVQGPSLSEYVGEVGERLRNLTAIYKSSRGFVGKYGWTNIHTFQIGENILVWFTAKECQLERGEIVDLTGTVKKHEEFRGVKTTQLSRCIIKEVV